MALYLLEMNFKLSKSCSFLFERKETGTLKNEQLFSEELLHNYGIHNPEGMI
ncbi:MAG: hypothetical protein Q8N03_16605 [Ignavibacteria bacterium]|nr:hypothetical protein [Ignavibacteria bacterium]